MVDIVVIGGGFGGLATAYRLQRLAQSRQQKVRITVLEASNRWGGVVQTSHEAGCLFEHGPDSIIRTKTAGAALIHDLGLDGEIVTTEPDSRRALIARGKRLIPVPEGFYLMAPGRLSSFLFSPLVSWRGKARMLCDLVLPKRKDDRIEESLAQFVRRRLGREALERIAQPMIGGIYTADPERLSLAATLPQFIAMEREHRSLIRALRKRARDDTDVAAAGGPRYGLFISLRGGLSRLIDALKKELESCDLRTNAAVTGVAKFGSGYLVTTAQEAFRVDQLAVALPANAAAKVTSGFDMQLSEQLAAVPYAGVATVNLVFDRNAIHELPQAAGMVIPAAEGRMTIACTFTSRKYAGRTADQSVSLRAFVGGALHPEALERSDNHLVKAVLRDLADLLGITAAPTLVRVHRWPSSMAQYILGHREHVAAIRAREAMHGDLALVGNGFEGVGIPDIAAQAEAAAARLAVRW